MVRKMAARGNPPQPLKCVAYISSLNRVCGANANKKNSSAIYLRKNVANYIHDHGVRRVRYGQVVAAGWAGDERGYLCSGCASYCDGRKGSKVTVPTDTAEHMVSDDMDVIIHWANRKQHRRVPHLSVREWYYTADRFSEVYCRTVPKIVCTRRLPSLLPVLSCRVD